MEEREPKRGGARLGKAMSVSLLFESWTSPIPQPIPPPCPLPCLSTGGDSVLGSTHSRRVSMEQLQEEPPQGHKVPSLALVDFSVGLGKAYSYNDLPTVVKRQLTAGCPWRSKKVLEDQARYLRAGLSKLLKSGYTWRWESLYGTL